MFTFILPGNINDFFSHATKILMILTDTGKIE